MCFSEGSLFQKSVVTAAYSIWDVIKQNESEVGSDMFLVSDYFHTSNIKSIELKPETCEHLQYYGLHLSRTWDKYLV